MSATDADREKVVAIIKQAMTDEKWLPPQPYKLHVYRLAAALADEREKAREQGYNDGYTDGLRDGLETGELSE